MWVALDDGIKWCWRMSQTRPPTCQFFSATTLGPGRRDDQSCRERADVVHSDGQLSFRKRHLERELDDELRAHIEMSRQPGC
jgi:hypothetical protein